MLYSMLCLLLMIDIKPKIRTSSDKIYAIFSGLNVPGYGVECDFFTVISFDFLLFYETKHYLQVYLDNWELIVVNMQIVDFLDDNLFESDKKVSYIFNDAFFSIFLFSSDL